MQDMADAYRAVLACADEGAAPELAVLATRLPENTVSLLSRLLARNYDVALGKKDLELYLDRIEQSVPKSVEAGRMSEQELEEYLARLREKSSERRGAHSAPAPLPIGPEHSPAGETGK